MAEALARLLALAPPPVAETVPLVEAAGRVLMRPVTAARAQPPFDASAMDGYALRVADAQPGRRLRVVGEAAAGRRLARALGPGEAARILTGAPLPDGADAVVMQEEVTRDGDHAVISDRAVAGHVRRAGNDFAAGARIDAPRLLAPADVALLAAFGAGAVDVARRPVVAILSTGDELVMPGEEPGPDQVFASNAFGLHALVRAAGGRPRLLPIAGDTLATLDAAFDLAADADLVVTIGGASVGDHDLVAPAARARGARLDFHRVAMRPGKPLLAGTLPDGAVLLGLPGNPVSAMVCGTVFLRPLMRAMLGLSAQPLGLARLGAALPANGPRTHYLRARRRPDGTVEAMERQDSSLLTVLAESDCLIVQPPGDPGRAAGDVVDIHPI